ncbi:hypothetical protein IW261DRAFT_1427578 [Armillaria novae-zelandiae]|uniref:Uncharacterized protein n=1 Tax=Armillaria novae-zelandiae TaxID=153914 RepID=A0AA39ND82_9AGAR|nr:hypothetical protein IW261DRAFT_1427578 [Armillaria novae-zelandiae]
MPPPRKYLTPKSKCNSVHKKSKRYYEKNKLQIRLRRKAAYDTRASQKTLADNDPARVNVNHITRVGRTNALEIQTRTKHGRHQAQPSPSSNNVPPPPPVPPTNSFPKLSVKAKALQDGFNSFIWGMSMHEYAKWLLKAYFKLNSQCQGQISVFADPLQDLYDLWGAYMKIQDRSLEAEGLSARHNSLVQAGRPINKVIEWVEDFWCYASDSPGSLWHTYNVRRLAWQRDTIG